MWDDPAQPGLHLRGTDHRFYDSLCGCGHHTRARPGEGLVDDPTFDPVALSEWRVVGAGLATLIVALHLRFRMSYRRMREFLHDWLGLSLSVGTLDRTLREAAAAALPLEQELIAAVVASDLLYADETSWPQGAELLWLWVFTSATVTLFVVAKRGRAVLDRLLPGFAGWLMSDGWQAYRHFPQRLRCWAHLTRKAQGLLDSFDREAQAFGHQVQTTFDTLIGAIHAARAGPSAELPQIHATLLAELHAACVQLLGHRHTKTRALAVELWNDWDAIFRVLENPQWPLTNNDAERALRHWVIARRIMMGTRCDAGSRTFTLLASVIETCRQRGQVPWPYLAGVIAERRAVARPLRCRLQCRVSERLPVDGKAQRLIDKEEQVKRGKHHQARVSQRDRQHGERPGLCEVANEPGLEPVLLKCHLLGKADPLLFDDILERLPLLQKLLFQFVFQFTDPAGSVRRSDESCGCSWLHRWLA